MRKVYVPFNIPIASEYGIEPADLDDPEKPAWWVRSSAAGLWDEPVYAGQSGQYIVTPGNELFFDEEPVYENGYLEGSIAGYQILVDPNDLGCTLDTIFPEEVLTFPTYFTGPPKLKFSLLASAPSDFMGPVVISSQREPEKAQLPIKIYPNPAKNEVQISYELEQAASVSLAIFNAGGQLVYSIDYVPQPSGQYTQTIGFQHLIPGVYFCTLVSDRFYHTTKLIKL
ncbi:MAG: T9SS type A sorting domain-containing protein [Saprospiraceae bacterium]|nr:T9SS type A sorting domain-containing protein [Saprospiraceae bacterium]